MKRFIASLLAFVIALSSWNAAAVIRAGGTGQSPGAVSITGGTISGTTLSTTTLNNNVRTVIQSGGIPLVAPGSFTMGNNGAVTLGTALNIIPPNAYMYFLAGDVAAGVPAAAGWYYVTCTTTTACTAFNNTYTSGVPTIPGSPTAFATTGPGARTGDTAAENAHTISIPALGANSQVILTMAATNTNNANTKTYTIKFGGTSFQAGTGNSVGRIAGIFVISNTGATNKQSAQYGPSIGFAVTTQEVQGTVDTTSAQNLIVTIQRGTATDNIILLPPLVEVVN